MDAFLIDRLLLAEIAWCRKNSQSTPDFELGYGLGLQQARRLISHAATIADARDTEATAPPEPFPETLESARNITSRLLEAHGLQMFAFVVESTLRRKFEYDACNCASEACHVLRLADACRETRKPFGKAHE